MSTTNAEVATVHPDELQTGPRATPGPDEASWRSIAAQMGGVSVDNLAHLPDFLVISPPRTGTTWLSANLAGHPEIFSTQDPKEIKYFSDHWRFEDLNWYLDHFKPGAGKVKGEASPSYGILPVRMIEVIRAIVPHVRLIFLMRDPVERAWSHTKHACTEREANFRGYDGPFDAVPDATLIENFTHEWMLASGDYLGALQRWSAVFPKSQIFVGFYESIRRDPKALLRQLFTFLGVTPTVAWNDHPYAEVLNPERTARLSESLRAALLAIYRGRTEDLVRYLRREWDLEPPPEWSGTLNPSGQDGSVPVALSSALPQFVAHLDDDRLDGILQRQVTPLPPQLVVEGYRGFNVVKYAGRLYGLPQAIGAVPFPQLAAADLQFFRRAASAGSLPGLVRLIDAMADAASGASARSPDERADVAGALSGVVRLARAVAEAERAAATLAAREAELVATRSQLAAAEAEQIAVRSQVAAGEGALRALRESYEAAESSLSAKAHELSVTQAELAAARTTGAERAAELEREAGVLRGDMANLEAEVAELHEWIERLQTELVAGCQSWWSRLAGRRRS